MFQDPPYCLCWEKSKTLRNVILLVLQQMEDWVYASCPVDFPLMFQFNLFCSKCQQKMELSKKKLQEFFSVTYSPAWMGLTGDITLRFSFWHTEVKKHCFTAVLAFSILPNLHINASKRNQLQFFQFIFFEEAVHIVHAKRHAVVL